MLSVNEMQQYCGRFKMKHNLTVAHPVSVVKHVGHQRGTKVHIHTLRWQLLACTYHRYSSSLVMVGRKIPREHDTTCLAHFL